MSAPEQIGQQVANNQHRRFVKERPEASQASSRRPWNILICKCGPTRAVSMRPLCRKHATLLVGNGKKGRNLENVVKPGESTPISAEADVTSACEKVQAYDFTELFFECRASERLPCLQRVGDYRTDPAHRFRDFTASRAFGDSFGITKWGKISNHMPIPDSERPA